MASDQVELPVDGRTSRRATSPRRSRRRGSGGTTTASACCSKGATKGGQKGELKQAEEVFLKVAELGQADGWVNLARVYQREGRIPDALAALEKAAAHKEPAAPWVINWLTGQINASQRPARRGDRELRGRAEDANPRAEVRLRPRLRGDQRAGLGALHRWRGPCRSRAPSARNGSRRRSPPIAARWRSTPRTSPPITAWAWPSAIPPGARRTLENPSPAAAEAAAVVDPDELLRLAAVGGRPQGRTGAPKGPSRCELARLVVRYMKGPGPGSSRGSSRSTSCPRRSARSGSRRPTAIVQAAIGRALEVTHKALHERLKPDETAEGRVFAIARKNDPAANMNAQSIVIHSLHRPGHPGSTPHSGCGRGRTSTTLRRPRTRLMLRRVENDGTSHDRLRQAPEPDRTGVPAPCGRRLRRREPRRPSSPSPWPPSVPPRSRPRPCRP